MKASSEYGISHDICTELMAPLLSQGYHLFTDNWYTAVPLAESLLSVYHFLDKLFLNLD